MLTMDSGRAMMRRMLSAVSGSELREIRVYQLVSLIVIMLSNPWETIDP